MTTGGVTGVSVEDVSRCRGCVEAMRRAMRRACIEPNVEDVEARAQRAPLLRKALLGKGDEST